MIKTFTRNDVVKLVYNELECEEKADVLEFLADHKQAMRYYKALRKSANMVESLMMQPSQSSVNSIMAYSKARR